MAADLPPGDTMERLLVVGLAGAPQAQGPVRPVQPMPPPAATWPLPDGWQERLAGASAEASVILGREADRGTRFLMLPVLLASGALIYFGLRAEPPAASLAAVAGTLALAAWLARRRPLLLHLLAALLAVVLGMLAGKVETMRAGTRIIAGEISTTVTGRVLAIEHQANGRVRLTLDVLATAAPQLRYQPDRVRLSARRVPAGLGPGDEIVGLARLGQPSGPVRPGGYDFAFRAYFDGIGATGFFLRDPALSPHPAEPDRIVRLRSAVEAMRLALAERVRGAIGGPEGEIAAALIVGVRAGIPENVNEALRRTGLAHVLSISGLHMALVAATIMGGLRLAFAFFPDFSSRHPVRKTAAAAALAGSLAYLLISGADVAAQRSFIMLAVMLAALMADRAALTIRNLAIAAILVILWSPHEVVGPSFQMSFAATAALIGAYGVWAERRMRRGRLPPRSVAGRIARWVLAAVLGLAFTSLIAGLATTIYGVYHFQRVSPLSLAANLAAMPIVSVLVMPFAVLAVVAMPFSLDGPFLAVMGFGLRSMIVVAEWFSARSPLDAVGLVSGRSVLVLTAALAVATLSTTRLRLLALPVGIVGLAMASLTPTPTVFVSEDAALVGVDLGDGRMAVNRSRPNGFAADNWMRSLAADEMVVPEKQAGAGASSEASAGVKVATELARAGDTEVRPAGFRCTEGLCVAHLTSGDIVAHAADEQSAGAVCGLRGVLIIADPSARNPCDGKAILAITGRRLARRGSAAISFPRGNGQITVEYAIAEPYRPWHDHRRFSRGARGQKPWTPASKGKEAANTGSSSATSPQNGAEVASGAP